jgi:hypothetical protein
MSTDIPKIMHFYWDKSTLCYLQYMTIISFNKFNPDWRIIIHEGNSRCGAITWNTGEQTIKYSGEDWYYKLKELDYVEFRVVDFESIGFREDVSEIFKSDYLRWYLLSTIGGGWSDMDILFTKPLTELNIGDANTVICFRGDVHIIGFFLSKSNNEYFKKILDEINYDFDLSDYQSLGSVLFNKVHPSDTTDCIDVKIKNISMDCLYSYRDYDIPIIFQGIDLTKLMDETIGVHWYNGSRVSKFFNNNYDPNTQNISNTITEILKMIQ